jgi:hypothetical protein
MNTIPIQKFLETKVRFTKKECRKHKVSFEKLKSEREKIAESTGEIDFDCRFKDGKCKIASSNNSRCCCRNCLYYHGYIISGFLTKKEIEDISKLFDGIENGFWRENIGCILPRKYRSATCLCYNCSNNSQTIQKVRQINNELREYDIVSSYAFEYGGAIIMKSIQCFCKKES